jgi:hypothetical protein
MKLHTDTHQVTGSGFDAVTDFTVEVNSKTFKVLSDTIYKDKIGSIVRELSCNAFDAHTVAGKSEVPFEIHLPDAFEPYFSIRDFGTGISPEDIKSVYTKYFSSTKDQSNDEVGAFGLGSKTPFSYTDAFTVISIHNGIKTMYNAHVNNGLPSIVAYGKSEPTTEPDGLEVNVGVNTVDHKDFEKAVKRQLKFFPVKPTILNGEIKWDTYEAILEHDGFKLYTIEGVNSWSYGSRNSSSGLFVKQGPVGYPVDFDILDSYLASKDIERSGFYSYLKTASNYNNKGVIIEMPIGTVEVTASREAISYSDITIQNIFTKLDSISTKIFDDVKAQLDAAYKDSPKTFFDTFTGLDDYFTSSIKSEELNKAYPRFVFSPNNSLWYRVSKNIGRNILFESYQIAGFSKPKVVSRNNPRNFDQENPKSPVVIKAEYLFSDDFDTRFLKDVKTRFIQRIEDNADRKAIVVTLFDNVTLDDFNKWTKDSVSLVSLDSLPAPVSTRKSGGTGHSITGGNNRVWFEISKLNPYNEDFISGRSTLYRDNFKQVFGDSIENAIDDSSKYVYFLTHGNKIIPATTGISDPHAEAAEVRVFLQWLESESYNVIAIPKNSESKISDLPNVVSFKDMWNDRENTFYVGLMDQFKEWAELHYYTRAHRVFFASRWRDDFSMRKVLDIASEFNIDATDLLATIPEQIKDNEIDDKANAINYGTIYDLLGKQGLSTSDTDKLMDMSSFSCEEIETVLERVGVNIKLKVSDMMETYKKWLFANLNALILAFVSKDNIARMFRVDDGLAFRDPLNNNFCLSVEELMEKVAALAKRA